jgi:outer membrane protein assembly factor BamB
MPARAYLTTLLLLYLGSQASAQDWVNWRGPQHDGSSTVEGLPMAFDQEANVLWKTVLPGSGASTPIVVGERVFLTSVDSDAGQLLAICLDRDSGEVLWQHSAGSGYQAFGAGEPTTLGSRSNYASPSAVSDGVLVTFFFGNGDLVAYDMEGEQRWRRNLQEDLGEFQFQWTFSATPTLWEDRLVLPILQRDAPVNDHGKEGTESFILGLDPATGKTLFRTVRPSDARVESRESYATAIPYVTEEGRKELIVVGGDVISGHDPLTGEEFWRWGTWNPGHREQWWRVVPSAVVGGGVALACAPKGAPVFAVQLGGKGSLDDASLAWKSEGRRSPVTSDVPTPLYYRDHFYILSDLRSMLSKVHPGSGEVVWSVPMPRDAKWRASPTGADGRVWCMDHGARVVAIDAESGEIVTVAQMGGEENQKARSSVVPAHGSLFIRTDTSLFRVGFSESDADSDED